MSCAFLPLWFFELKPKQSIMFRSAQHQVQLDLGTRTTMKQDHAAVFCAARDWERMRMANISFVTQWTMIHGLKPKRPIIVFGENMSVPAKSALLLV